MSHNTNTLWSGDALFYLQMIFLFFCSFFLCALMNSVQTKTQGTKIIILTQNISFFFFFFLNTNLKQTK